jgi:Icc-related predicted phosphoesterase
LKIQYFSDLHLEFGNFQPPATDADVIIAAGDIGVGLQGVEWLQRYDRPVVYVAGNHEYYGGDVTYTREAIVAAAADSNIHFLENDSTVIDGVRFLGATLWTDYMDGDPKYMARALEQMNDYQQIRIDSVPLSPERLYDINWESRFWLASELDETFDGDTVVVTHHAPSMRSWHLEEQNYYRAAYCNQMDEMLRRNTIALWVHGHVHATRDYDLHEVHVVCNPRGYVGYQPVAAFDPLRTTEV